MGVIASLLSFVLTYLEIVSTGARNPDLAIVTQMTVPLIGVAALMMDIALVAAVVTRIEGFLGAAVAAMCVAIGALLLPLIVVVSNTLGLLGRG